MNTDEAFADPISRTWILSVHRPRRVVEISFWNLLPVSEYVKLLLEAYMEIAFSQVDLTWSYRLDRIRVMSRNILPHCPAIKRKMYFGGRILLSCLALHSQNFTNSRKIGSFTKHGRSFKHHKLVENFDQDNICRDCRSARPSVLGR